MPGTKKPTKPRAVRKRAQPERILEARYVRPSKMFLRFADRFEGEWTFRQLNLEMSGMKAATIAVSESGASVDVKSKWGDDVELDGSSLRASIDPVYAADIEKKLNTLAARIGL